jgi:hypothetical protein
MYTLKEIIAAGLLALPLVAGMPGCKQKEEPVSIVSAEEQLVQKENELRSTVLSYLSQPKFSNSDFMAQVTGTKAELQMWDLDEKMLYLTMPEESFTQEQVAKLSSNPNTVEFGKTSDGKLTGFGVKLGDYNLSVPETYFFRFPSADFKVDQSASVNIPYKSVTYSITMQELQSFANNRNIFGGSLYVDTGTNEYGAKKVIANHGAFVAKKGEKSLERLVNSLAGKETSKEAKAQKLLDFVTSEIKYDMSDAEDGERLKQPNEVLMTGGSDCSGKVILYASLLEQAGIDYRLIYTEGHITVAVEGNYPDLNDLGFKLGEKSYSIAETTTQGFKIGRTRVQGLDFDSFKYIQRPGKDSKLVDAKTGFVLSYVH